MIVKTITIYVGSVDPGNDFDYLKAIRLPKGCQYNNVAERKISCYSAFCSIICPSYARLTDVKELSIHLTGFLLWRYNETPMRTGEEGR